MIFQCSHLLLLPKQGSVARLLHQLLMAALWKMGLLTYQSLVPNFNFPPPVFLGGSLGDKQLKLLHAGNVKLKILILVLTLAIVAGVALGIWIVLTHYNNNTSHAPKEPTCVELAATLEDALQAITRLSELVTTLTRSTQDSSPSTSSSNTSVVSNSWSNCPRYTWG